MDVARPAAWLLVAGALATACGSPRDAPPLAAPADAAADAESIFEIDAGGCAPDPANFDVPNNGCDDDANGAIDDAPTCDASLPITGDADLFARALDLCQRATGPGDARWGLIAAEYKGSFSTGTAAAAGAHGIVSRFGDVVRPRAGASMGVLSSGWAREFDNPGATLRTPFKGGSAMQPGDPRDDAPPGFPKAAAGCAIDDTVHDVIDVKLTLKAPANARGFQFDFDFWSGEWPEFVCTKFNDAFVAYVASRALPAGADNVSFDAQGAPVSVNNGFFDRCTPGTPTGCQLGGVAKTSSCPGGPDELRGTGFLDEGSYCGGVASTGGGATGWLTSSAPVVPGEVLTIELIVWDTGDQNYDSSVLLDHFRWLDTPTSTGTERPPR